MSARIAVCFLFLLLTLGGTFGTNVTVLKQRVVDVSYRCPDYLHRVDAVTSEQGFRVIGQVEYNSTLPQAWWQRSHECRVSFATGKEQGLCVDFGDIEILASGVVVDFLTTPYRPDKHYSMAISSGNSWCTHKNLLTMVIKLPRGQKYLMPDAFNFDFNITNRSISDIEKTFNMGSAAQCDMHYILQAKESAVIKSHEIPASDPAPEVCRMTFTSLSQEEYGQVCVRLERYDTLGQCDMELEVTKLNPDYWEETVTYDCDTLLNETQELCSGKRFMAIKLKRGRDLDSASFDLRIASKWMTYWESAEEMKVELNYLSAAKSFTVLIATLDTLVVLAAAFISVATRYPYGRLKYIADIFGKDPSVPLHYGNEYPVAVAVTSGEGEPPPF